MPADQIVSCGFDVPEIRFLAWEKALFVSRPSQSALQSAMFWLLTKWSMIRRTPSVRWNLR